LEKPRQDSADQDFCSSGYAALFMVAACSKSLTNPSIEECLQHAHAIRKGNMAAQWNALDGSLFHPCDQTISGISSGSQSDRDGTQRFPPLLQLLSYPSPVQTCATHLVPSSSPDSLDTRE